jgi:NAD(P)-dependent dehydrogenase (short-subunit alcohol dehydrogenase family)
MAKVWFITGSSRGLGRILTEAVLEAGDLAAATARNPEMLRDLEAKYPDRVCAFQLDVTNNTQIGESVQQTIEKFGRIDVLVNNAGFGIIGAAEAYSEEQVRRQLEINLYGPIAITRAVLPYMRQQRSGRILQISSTGGRVGSPGLTVYQAAKFGLTGFSESLAKEVKPMGIWVTSIEPGGMRTEMTPTMDCAREIEGYESTVGQRIERFKGGKFVPSGDPHKVAKVLIALANSAEPPVHLVLGSEAIARVRQASVERNEEMENWLPASTSIDADDVRSK